MTKTQLVRLAGVLAASLALVSGCGSSTTSCGEGTHLEDGACVVDTSGCGQGTALQADGVCTPVAAACEDGTTFDQERQRCVPHTEIMCGQGTVANADGVCVLTEAACAEGLVLDPERAECVSSEEVCGDGTRFDAEHRRCLPDSCEQGDVLVDEVCLSEAEALAGQADLVEVENNDPAYGGTPQVLGAHAVGEGAFVFVGTIGAPQDLDGDGELDQDVDVFEFDAEAGEWFEISVAPLGSDEPAFRVEGAESFVRHSPLGASQAARTVVIPADGTYTVAVLPSLVLYGGAENGGAENGGVEHIGDDWDYVASIASVAPPAPVSVDMSSGQAQLVGQMTALADNVFELTGLSVESLVAVEVEVLGEDVEALLELWQGTTVRMRSEPIRAGVGIDLGSNGADANLLLDWTSNTGPNVGFELAARVAGKRRVVTMGPGTSETVEVVASVYQKLTAHQFNPPGDDLEIEVIAPSGATLASQTLPSGETLRAVAPTAGTYAFELSNTTSHAVDATLTMRADTVAPLGPLSVGASDTYAHLAAVPEGDGFVHTVTLSEPGRLHVRASAPSPDPEVVVYDASLAEIERAETYASFEDFIVEGVLGAGVYLVEVYAFWDLASYELTVELLP